VKISPQDDIINSATPLEDTLYGVHPRLYASDADFACLRRLAKKEPYASMLERVRQFVSSYPNRNSYAKLEGDVRTYGDVIASLAMLWKITGERHWLTGTRALMRSIADRKDWGVDLEFGHFAHGVALAWDWLYHDIPRKEREHIADRMIRHGRVFFDNWADYNHFAAFAYTWNHMAVPLTGLTAVACALYGERPCLAPWVKMAMEKMRLMTDSLGPDGISPEGIAYGQYHAEYLARTAMLLKKMSGVDFLSSSPWWREYAVASLYHTYPRQHWRNKQVFFMLGDADRHHWLGPDPVLRLCARVFRDGHAQWLADELHTTRSATDYSAFLSLLWHDPTVRKQGPRQLPRVRHFTDQDIAFLRSGWDGSESVLAFKCGPHSGYHNLRYSQNVSGGHMHPMAGAIALHAKGDFLLVESGYPRKATKYENTLLVNGRGQIGEGGDWFEDLEFRRGHPTPRMLAVGHRAGFDFAIGDATNAYPDNLRLERFIRHIYAVGPDSWILVDEVAAAKPSTFELLFHGDRPFVAQGERRFIQRGERGSLLIESLLPLGVKGLCRLQAVDGIGQAARNKNLGCLSLAPVRRTRHAIFLTFLHAFQTGKGPDLTLELKTGGTKSIIELKGRGATGRFALRMKRAGPADPVLCRF